MRGRPAAAWVRNCVCKSVDRWNWCENPPPAHVVPRTHATQTHAPPVPTLPHAQAHHECSLGPTSPPWKVWRAFTPHVTPHTFSSTPLHTSVPCPSRPVPHLLPSPSVQCSSSAARRMELPTHTRVCPGPTHFFTHPPIQTCAASATCRRARRSGVQFHTFRRCLECTRCSTAARQPSLHVRVPVSESVWEWWCVCACKCM